MPSLLNLLKTENKLLSKISELEEDEVNYLWFSAETKIYHQAEYDHFKRTLDNLQKKIYSKLKKELRRRSNK